MPSENAIGDFPFIAIRGEAPPLAETMELDQRNGVDGTEFTLVGRKGEPFQLLTVVDSNTYETALQEAGAYTDLVAEEAVELIRDGVLDGLVKVLRVNPVKVRAIRSAVGGINPPSTGWIEAVWDLVRVETP